MPTTYETHPAADILPTMTEEEFEGLTEDIRQYGQRDDCVLWQGKILDGKHRYRACSKLGIETRCELDECKDPVAYVLSKNLHRRQLTQNQRSVCAAKAEEYYKERAKERQRASGGNHAEKAVLDNCPGPTSTARDEAGKAFGVSGRSVDQSVPRPDGQAVLGKRPGSDSEGQSSMKLACP